MIKDIRYLFQHEEDYCRPVKVGNFWSNNYVEYESFDDRNKTLSIEEHPHKFRSYLNDIINDFRKSDT